MKRLLCLHIRALNEARETAGDWRKNTRTDRVLAEAEAGKLSQERETQRATLRGMDRAAMTLGRANLEKDLYEQLSKVTFPRWNQTNHFPGAAVNPAEALLDLEYSLWIANHPKNRSWGLTPAV